MFKNEESFEEMVTEVMNKCESLIDQLFKASGMSVMDVLSFDAETGAAIAGCMDLYKNSKELAIMQAKATDNIIESFEELKKENKNLRKQNDEMQQLLRHLIRKVENIGK